MSITGPAVLRTNYSLSRGDAQLATNRRSAKFTPSAWGDFFLQYASESTATESMKQEHEELKERIRIRLVDNEIIHCFQKLDLIHLMQCLGVSHHFQTGITDELRKMYHAPAAAKDTENNSYLYYVALRFRLLRQQGYRVPCDVFEKFRDDQGKFKETLRSDVQGLLSLYEAAHLGNHGEDVLDEAITFTTFHLKSILLTAQVSLREARQIKSALYRPIQKSIQYLDARNYISYYEEDESFDRSLLNFAKLDFNIRRSQYQKELAGLTKWWKDLDTLTNVPWSRDRLVEGYFWTLGAYSEPQYSMSRLLVTKLVTIITLVDDTYDSYGTLEELVIFTEAVKRWNIEGLDVLPEYMKPLYKILLDFFVEVEEEALKQPRPSFAHYAVEDMKKLILGYFNEAKWFFEGYTPTMEKYMQVATVTISQEVLNTMGFSGMGDLATDEQILQWTSRRSKVIKAAAVVSRLMNDIKSHKRERETGQSASAVECYMKQYSVSKDKAVEELQKIIKDAWKDLNDEYLKPNCFIPLTLLEHLINWPRTADIVYKYDDVYTGSNLWKEKIKSYLVDPIATKYSN